MRANWRSAPSTRNNARPRPSKNFSLAASTSLYPDSGDFASTPSCPSKGPVAKRDHATTTRRRARTARSALSHRVRDLDRVQRDDSSCGQDDYRQTTATTPATKQLEVGIRTFSFTNPTGTTYNYATGKTHAGRTIGVEIDYPTYHGSPGTETPNVPIVSPEELPAHRLRARIPPPT